MSEGMSLAPEGVIEDADQVTDLTGPCGDTMKISMDIEGDRINDAKIQVLGCPGAVASGCAVVGLAKGMTLAEAKNIDLNALYRELEKMPELLIEKNVKKLILTHLPEGADKDQIKAMFEKAGFSNVDFASEGMEIEV